MGFRKEIEMPKSSNPAHFQTMQFTVDNLLCGSPCRPDPEVNGDRDICDVTVGESTEAKECTKIASINAMRVVVQESRNNSTKEFATIIGMMDELMLE
jgi:hypothetical protein